MNKIMLIGRNVKEPELMATKNGTAVLDFNLAVNRDYKNENGEYETDFIKCVAYKKTAELIKNYVKKGDKLFVEGKLQTRNYENNEGKKIYVTEVIVSNIEFLESKKENTADNADKENDPFENFGNNITVEQIDDNMLPF